jgi:response regulator RpfG family c-di-GMP phosphodiesterase
MNEIKARILIVDNEIYIQEILQATLTDAGFECICVSDAESALDRLAAQQPDIALIDTRLPGIQGTELLAEIRAKYPRIMVIMTSILDKAGAAAETMKMGAYDYIVKPFNLEQVAASASCALEKRRQEDSARDYQIYLEQAAEERAVETRRLFYSMTQVLIRLLDLKVPFNAGHAFRVSEMSRYLARELRMTEDGVRKVYLAALLHDVMLMVVEDPILTKRGSLTPEEHSRIQQLTSMTQDVLKPILDDEEVLKNIRNHRERYDGTGYPDGLKGKKIPLGARIIAVVEAFDAMTRERPYRAASTPEVAIAELHRCAETQFDPQVVAVFDELYYRVLCNLDKSAAGLP